MRKKLMVIGVWGLFRGDYLMQVQEMAFKQLNKLKVIYCGWGEEWELGQLAASTVRGRYVFEYTPQGVEPVNKTVTTILTQGALVRSDT